MTRAVYRFRLAVICFGIVTLTFLQDPGLTASDTKLDLTQNPEGFMARALHVWDPSGFFGQLQNQAYGYLWPHGPFFAALQAVDITPWVSQRIWWSVVLLTAFLGSLRLMRLIGFTNAPARVIAALAYAFSARLVTELGPISVEAWPTALAPWLVIPLVRGAQGGSPRRWAGLSGLVFLMAGGVNAVAAAAILPAGGLYILTRRWGPRMRSLLVWWLLAVVLASVWWILPLLVLGKYSPPFLDWIEGSKVTTLATDPASMLRGVTQWVAHLTDGGGPVWHAGWVLVTGLVPVACGLGVLAVSVVGLLRRGMPERTYVLVTLLCGMLLLGLGHVAVAPWTGFFAESIQRALDGGLAPLRNIHKFQALVSLPLALAFAHGCTWILSRTPGSLTAPFGSRRRFPIPGVTAVVACTALVLGAAAPALAGDITKGRGFVSLPTYWSEASDWLNNRTGNARTLIIPSASFGQYMWGRPQDEPLQVLGTRSWGVRDAVPLSSAGNIRFLDEIERRLASGTGSPGLAPALLRAGVRWLLVRNDLDQGRTRATSPALIRQALSRSPGILLAQGFGPVLNPSVTESRLTDGGATVAHRAVEIYWVNGNPAASDARVLLRDASTVRQFSGGPESLLDLEEHRALRLGALVAEGDPVPPDVAVKSLVTDSYRRSETNFGSVRNQYSETMTGDQSWRSVRRVHDYELDTGQAPRAVTFEGVHPTASSSGSSPFAIRARGPEFQPWAALDGDPDTAWVSGDIEPAVGQWWQADFDQERQIRSLKVRVVRSGVVGPYAERILVGLDDADIPLNLQSTGGWQTLDLSDTHTTKKVRLTLTGVSGGGQGQGFGLAEVELPGGPGTRSIDLGSSAADGGIVLSARGTGRSACVEADGGFVCHPDLGRAKEEKTEIRRVLTLTKAGDFNLTATFRPRPGPELYDRLVLPSRGVTVTSSSDQTAAAPARGQAAFDGDIRTTWIASPIDPNPTLILTLPKPATVSGLRFSTIPNAPASVPISVDIKVGDRTYTSPLDSFGQANIPATVTDRVVVTFSNIRPRVATDGALGVSVALPVGITEMAVTGSLQRSAQAGAQFRVPFQCGFAPTVVVDGRKYPTSARSTVGSLIAEAAVPGRSCGGPVRLSAGRHEIVVKATDDLLVDSVAFMPISQAAPDQDVILPQIKEWGSTRRTVSFDALATPRTLETTENFNAGWIARIGDQPLQALRVDGWRQAFFVPAGLGGEVELTFAPDVWYRGGLVVGLLMALMLLPLVLIRGRMDPPPAPAVEMPGIILFLTVTVSGMAGGVPGLAVCGLVLVGAFAAHHLFAAERARRLIRTVGFSAMLVLAGGLLVLRWPGRTEHIGLYTAIATALPIVILAAAACLGGRAAVAPGDRRLLHEVPGHPGHGTGADRRGRPQQPEPAAEDADAEKVADDREDHQMPQEDAV